MMNPSMGIYSRLNSKLIDFQYNLQTWLAHKVELDLGL